MTTDELYKRLLNFAIQTQKFVKNLPNTVYNHEYGNQLIRSSSSPGANYIEAIEAISPKDFIHRLKLCRKETKESIHWLLLIQNTNDFQKQTALHAEKLIKEAQEFIKIFSASIITYEKNQRLPKQKNR